MGWFISNWFLGTTFIVCLGSACFMLLSDCESGMQKLRWFKCTYIGIFAFLICFTTILVGNLKVETVYATDWKQIFQNDKDIDLTLAFDDDFEYKIPLNEPLVNTQIYNSGDNSKVLNYIHYLTLKKDNASLTRKAKLTELVGETSSTAKIIKVEYRKIDYTYNRLFNFVGSHEKSEYDGELRLTFDNGEGAITSDDLSNFLEK